MATIAQLVEDIADVMKEPRETVNAYARALIDTGLLPKSRGRAIAHAEPVHIVRLFLAVALQPKIKDAAAVVEKYGGLTCGGIPHDFPDSVKRERLEDFLAEMWTVLMTDGKGELRDQYRESEIEIIETWPEASVHLPGGGETISRGTIRFSEPGHGMFWQGYTKRSAIIHGRAFVFLGSGKGRDYFEGAAE